MAILSRSITIQNENDVRYEVYLNSKDEIVIREISDEIHSSFIHIPKEDIDELFKFIKSLIKNNG